MNYITFKITKNHKNYFEILSAELFNQYVRLTDENVKFLNEYFRRGFLFKVKFEYKNNADTNVNEVQLFPFHSFHFLILIRN